MKTKNIKIGIIGCGAIGSAIAKYCAKNLADTVTVKAIFDIDKEKTEALKRELAGGVIIEQSLEGLISSCDLVIEAASVDAAPQVLRKSIELKKDAVIISTGGLVDKEDLLSSARKNGCNVYIPSGAVLGLDGLRAARLSSIEEAVLTTRKPVAGLRGAPYIMKNKINLDSIKNEELIFEGSASEAIKAFPKNINVSATLSLAGIGAEKTKVKIMCSPAYKKNTHEIVLKGEFGNFLIRAENVPSPDNPKTSYLAVLSAIATIKGIVDSVKVGT
jgi:aspartate dehydrogenase